MSIPKIIHYCWMSGDPFPKDIDKCIRSWSEIMPDYKIKLWNTSNFDCSILPYAEEAWNKRKYAFVSDIVRLYAIYTEGGIYLDSDIEVFRRFDDLLENRAFIGFESGNRLGPWLIASEKNNPLIKELLAYYNGRHFCDDDGYLDLTPNTVPVTRILSQYGLKPQNTIQRLPNITVYPEDYFCPKNPWTNTINITEHSYAMHLFAGAWNENAVDEMRFVGEVSKNIGVFLQWKEKHEPASEIIIYGTGVVGMRCYESLFQEGKCISCFMVTKRDNKWREIDGIPVKEINESSSEDKRKVVLVGTNPRSHNEIRRSLLAAGYNIIFLLGSNGIDDI